MMLMLKIPMMLMLNTWMMLINIIIMQLLIGKLMSCDKLSSSNGGCLIVNQAHTDTINGARFESLNLKTNTIYMMLLIECTRDSNSAAILQLKLLHCELSSY